MSSNILSSLGLQNLDVAYIAIVFIVLFVIIFAIIIAQGLQLKRLKSKYKKFMKGKDAECLEEEIMGLYEDNKQLFQVQKQNGEDIKKIYSKLENAFQKVGIVRYDAYQQLGGMLSFSLALLDENDSGFILNSVHSTDSCYTYTKEIKNGKCDIELSNEEKVALKQAMEK